MRRIGYWSAGACPPTDPRQLYAGIAFEPWLQFVFLPAVKAAAASGEYANVPPYRVGVAALRQYDYHGTVPEALGLMNLCGELEDLLNPAFAALKQKAKRRSRR
jgi:hypothetical protein